MPRYLIQAPHTAERCRPALSELLQQGVNALAQFDFTCTVADGSDHLAVAVIEAADEVAARETVPAVIRDQATVTEVRKVTPEEVRAFQSS